MWGVFESIGWLQRIVFVKSQVRAGVFGGCHNAYRCFCVACIVNQWVGIFSMSVLSMCVGGRACNAFDAIRGWRV